MLKGNEYDANVDTVGIERNLGAAIQTVEACILDSIDAMDVQPPTQESLETSVRKGIKAGVELQKRGFGKVAVEQAIVLVKTRNFDSGIINDNATAFGHAAKEAYLASGFRYLSSDLENPILPEVAFRQPKPDSE